MGPLSKRKLWGEGLFFVVDESTLGAPVSFLGRQTSLQYVCVYVGRAAGLQCMLDNKKTNF